MEVLAQQIFERAGCLFVMLFHGFEQKASRYDRPGSPEHHSVKFIRALFVSDDDTRPWRQELFDRRPLSFTIVALYEVFGWYAWKGFDFRRCGFQDENGQLVRLPRLFTVALPTLKVIAERLPELAYILPIATALFHGETPNKPEASKSLLYGPLVASNRRCGLSTCRQTAANVDRFNLLRCGGGCEGLEQYCCEAHQKQDWKRHKQFCVANRRVALP